MEADNAPKWWHAGICKIESKHAEIMHINIDNTLNGGEDTRSGENTHTYPITRTDGHQGKAGVRIREKQKDMTGRKIDSLTGLVPYIHCARLSGIVSFSVLYHT